MTRPGDGPAPVPVQRVSGQVHAGRVRDGERFDSLDPDPAGDGVGELEPSIAGPPSPLSPAGAVWLTLLPTVTAVVLMAFGVWWLDALLVAAGLFATMVLHHVAAGLPFGFGHGFIRYQPDDGWPRGVQEDDDFHWSWGSAGAPGPPDSADRNGSSPLPVRARSWTPSAGHQR